MTQNQIKGSMKMIDHRIYSLSVSWVKDRGGNLRQYIWSRASVGTRLCQPLEWMSTGPKLFERAIFVQRSELLHMSNLIHVDDAFVIALDVYDLKVEIVKH